MDLRNGSTMGGRKIATLDDIISLEERLFGGNSGEDIPIYKLEIFSSRGNIFRNGRIDTWLEARVYRGARDVTDLIKEQDNLLFSWGRNTDNPPADQTWANGRLNSYRQHITKADVPVEECMFFCKLIDQETQKILLQSN